VATKMGLTGDKIHINVTESMLYNYKISLTIMLEVRPSTW